MTRKTPKENAELAARYDAIYGRDTDGSAFADQPLVGSDCEHNDLWWKLTGPNEDGWTCHDCEAQLGFRPDLDRSHAELKCSGIVFEFQHSKLIYISNGTMGEIIAENVAGRCRTENVYDQQSILRFILEDWNLSHTHAQFWQNRAERWLLGGEPIREGQEALWK